MRLRLDGKGLRRAWLRAQRLAPATARSSAEDVVADVVGVQAQDVGAAHLAIRARSRGLVVADVDAAVADRRSLVLTWSLRGTRHLHQANDVRWLLDLFGPRYAAGSPARNRQLGLDGSAGDRAVRSVETALASDGPLPRGEIKRRLAHVGIDPAGQAPVHVLRRAALEGVLCIVAPFGEQETYALLDEWVPPGEPLDPEAARERLARRYLAAHGPAAPADFAAWSGLGLTDGNRAWDAMAGDLVEVEEPRGTSWILASDEETVRTAALPRGPLRLLPAFDSLLLGYADRTPVVAVEHARRVNAGGGIIRPTVVADGKVVGTWGYRRRSGGSAGLVEVRAFDRLPEPDLAEAEEESTDIGRFLGVSTSLVCR